MKLPLLQIRWLQLQRQLKSLGVLYGLLLLLLLLPLLLYILYQKYHDPELALYISGAIALAVLLVQVSRSDKAFVFTHVPQPVASIFTEYAAFALPFIVPVLFTANWFYFPVLLLWFWLVANLKTSLQKTAILPRFFNLIPAGNFEWKSGLRSGYLLLLLLPLAAVATCWLKFVPLLFLWIFTTIVTGFYQECEPLALLFASGQSPGKVLHAKIKNHTLLLLVFLLPPLLLSTIFHPELWWVHGLFLLFQLSLITVAILLKYTTYTPNERLRGNSVLLAIASLGTVVPVMLPIPVIMSLRNYGKAIRNLNFYFHDQD